MSEMLQVGKTWMYPEFIRSDGVWWENILSVVPKSRNVS
jgi:hypothetical protein